MQFKLVAQYLKHSMKSRGVKSREVNLSYYDVGWMKHADRINEWKNYVKIIDKPAMEELFTVVAFILVYSQAIERKPIIVFHCTDLPGNKNKDFVNLSFRREIYFTPSLIHFISYIYGLHNQFSIIFFDKLRLSYIRLQQMKLPFCMLNFPLISLLLYDLSKKI